MSLDFEHLWKLVSKQYHRPEYSIHGPAHWRRVERNGLLLATQTGADISVVRLFALFHDSRRENDGDDRGHGARGAAYAASLRGEAYELSEDRFKLLRFACVWHTDGNRDDDPTIGTCWDADRLDLGRVGVIPDPEFMSTDFGREIAAFGSIQPFLQRARATHERTDISERPIGVTHPARGASRGRDWPRGRCRGRSRRARW